MQPNWPVVTLAISQAFSAIHEPVRFILLGDEMEIIDTGLFVAWNGNEYVGSVARTIPGVRYYPDGSGQPDEVDLSDICACLPEEIVLLASTLAKSFAAFQIDQAMICWDLDRSLTEDAIPY